MRAISWSPELPPQTWTGSHKPWFSLQWPNRSSSMVPARRLPTSLPITRVGLARTNAKSFTLPYLIFGSRSLRQSRVCSAPYASPQTSAAITLLRFIFYVPNGAWPVDAELAAESDSQILLASEAIITNGNVSETRELALYLGSMQPSPRAHEVLLKIAGRSDGAAEQARTCLTWHPQSADLPYLASILIASGDADARGTDRSSLPYSMVRGYGDVLTLRNFLEMAHREGWLTIGPERMIYDEEVPRPAKHQPRYMPATVLDQLNSHLGDLKPPWRRKILILQECGMRISELLQLPVDCLTQDARGVSTTCGICKVR